MRQRKLNKKLVLHKRTVSNLENAAMKNIAGGGTALCVGLTDFCIDTFGPNSCPAECYSNNPPEICRTTF